jgi:hypothetical protein
MRDGILYSAESLAAGNPEQFARFMVSIRALADSIGSITLRSRDVAETITLIRKAAVDVGFGKMVNFRTGKEESPEQ